MQLYLNFAKSEVIVLLANHSQSVFPIVHHYKRIIIDILLLFACMPT